MEPLKWNCCAPNCDTGHKVRRGSSDQKGVLGTVYVVFGTFMLVLAAVEGSLLSRLFANPAPCSPCRNWQIAPAWTATPA